MSTIKKYLKTAMFALTIGIFLGMSGMIAYASFSSVESNWIKYGPVNGYYYQNQSYCAKDTELPGAWAGTTVLPQWYGSAPAGYMGAQANLYNSAGSKISTGSWRYNSSTSYGISAVSSYTSQNGVYYSKGQTAAYNGNGYNYYSTYRSPNINWP